MIVSFRKGNFILLFALEGSKSANTQLKAILEPHLCVTVTVFITWNRMVILLWLAESIICRSLMKLGYVRVVCGMGL